MKPPFSLLSEWISNRWEVTVLNVIYSRRKTYCEPRINVILEHNNEINIFYKSEYNSDKTKQKMIVNKFRDIVKDNATQYDFSGLFIVYSAFAPLACQEADSKITQEEIKALEKRINNPDLWRISSCLGRVTFFFKTNAQVKANTANGNIRKYAKMYFEILKPYDEFNYLKLNNLTVTFDSKQNFETQYEGNWFYYYK